MSPFHIGGKQEKRPCQGHTLVSSRASVCIQAVWFHCLCTTKQIVWQCEKCYSRARAEWERSEQWTCQGSSTKEMPCGRSWRVNTSPDRETGGIYPRQHTTAWAKAWSGKEQRVILHNRTKRCVRAWLAKKPELGARLLRALQPTLISSAGAEERDESGLSSSFQGSTGWFLGALSWIALNRQSLLRWHLLLAFSSPSNYRGRSGLGNFGPTASPGLGSKGCTIA